MIMAGSLSPSEIAAYWRDGVIFPISVLSAARVSELRRAFEALEQSLGGRPEPTPSTNLYFSWAYDLSLQPNVLDAVEALLGPEIIVAGSMILCKHPGHDAHVAWHQDGAYVEDNQAPAVSAWIALADSTASNGCMRVIPASHRQTVPHRLDDDPSNLVGKGRLGAGRTVMEEVDEAAAVDVVLRAGEMSLHHNRVIHGSRANCGDDKRIGFIVRYTTPAARSRGIPMVRARGTDDCPQLTLAERPPERTPDEALAAYLSFSAATRQAQAAAAGREQSR
jgi:non-haem Fe2+, alpha-ketoglutarate-dependent halogenase